MLESGGAINLNYTSTPNGVKCVASLGPSVIISYNNVLKGTGGELILNKTCASNNMPYGTIIYIPELAGIVGDGYYTVTDTKDCFCDFAIYSSVIISKKSYRSYVISWGDGKIAPSYTSYMKDYTDKQWSIYKNAWKSYKNMGGSVINLWKWNAEDLSIKLLERF